MSFYFADTIEREDRCGERRPKDDRVKTGLLEGWITLICH
jgi:hypothetical protein